MMVPSFRLICGRKLDRLKQIRGECAVTEGYTHFGPVIETTDVEQYLWASACCS